MKKSVKLNLKGKSKSKAALKPSFSSPATHAKDSLLQTINEAIAN